MGNIHVFTVFAADFDPKSAGDMSTLFDVGGILGKITRLPLTFDPHLLSVSLSVPVHIKVPFRGTRYEVWRSEA